MKTYTTSLIITFFLLFIGKIHAQSDIQVIKVNKDVSTHFTSKQLLDYTDISTNNVVGDMPLKNVLRIKPIKDFGLDLGYVTIVGEGFFVQYKLEYTMNAANAHKHIDIDAKKDIAFQHPDFSLTSDELKAYAVMMKSEKSSLNNVISKDFGMHVKLNNIWVSGEYIFFDYSAKNKTDLQYDIDEIRYKIVDKKLTKAESNQDKEIKALFTLNNEPTFEKEYRNIVAMKKFTFPDDKHFIIQISEDQISGRTVTLNVTYSDLLNAKTFKTL